LNAANEVAVEAFLERRIGFMAIAATVDAVLNALPNRSPTGSTTSWRPMPTRVVLPPGSLQKRLRLAWSVSSE
jgi:hypothetical protein